MNRLKTIMRPTGAAVPKGVTIVSLLSGKGGVGKSVIAFNLAERAAAAGSKTLLVDADICCGNQHILANIDPGRGLDAFALEQANLADAVCGFNEELDILARSVNGPLADLQEISKVADLASRLRRQAIGYDLVILDQGSGISNTATLLASMADSNLIVLVPELTSISDSFGLCKYLYRANQAIDLRMLINRVESDHEAEYIWTRFVAMTEQFLGRVPTLAGKLPEDEAVRKAVAAQRAIADLSPEVSVVQAFTRLAAVLTGVPAPTGSRISTQTINSTPATAEIRE